MPYQTGDGVVYRGSRVVVVNHNENNGSLLVDCPTRNYLDEPKPGRFIVDVLDDIKRDPLGPVAVLKAFCCCNKPHFS